MVGSDYSNTWLNNRSFYSCTYIIANILKQFTNNVLYTLYLSLQYIEWHWLSEQLAGISPFMKVELHLVVRRFQYIWFANSSWRHIKRWIYLCVLSILQKLGHLQGQMFQSLFFTLDNSGCWQLWQPKRDDFFRLLQGWFVYHMASLLWNPW